MIIYKITHKLSGKSYIGQTIRTLIQRWKEHSGGKHLCIALKNAVAKYGKDAFSVEEIASYTNLEDLNNAEEYYIDFYNTLSPNGYNLKAGGNNKTYSIESKAKMSAWQLGRKQSPEHIENKRLASIGEKNPFYGKKHTEETKQKIRDKKKGIPAKPRSPEYYANISKAKQGSKNPMFGKTPSEESRKKKSNSLKRAWAKRKENKNE